MEVTPMGNQHHARPRAFRFVTLFVFVVSLLFVTVIGAEQVSPAKDSQNTVANGFNSEKSASQLPLKAWLTFAGTITAALIAGLFAIYQLRRSIAAQHALEREKLITARKEAELARVHASAIEYRQAQVLPFLEQLDKTLNESYKTAYFPPYFPSLGGYVPQLRRYTDRAMSDWLLATENMSRHRIRLLLVLNQDRIETVASLLTKLIGLMNKILEVRNQVWFQKASEHDLWDVQRSYVSVGYQLMMEIRDAISGVPMEQASISESAKKSMAETLSLSFEKASAVSISYGSKSDFCWIAIWEVDKRPEWQRYLESMTKATQDDFEGKLKDLTQELYERGKMLDVKLTKVTMEELEVPCLVASFASAKYLEHFLDSDLETYRQANPILWSSYRSPIEIVVGAEERRAKGEGSRPNE